MFVPSKSKSVLGCFTTEPVSSDAVNRNETVSLKILIIDLLTLQGALVRDACGVKVCSINFEPPAESS